MNNILLQDFLHHLDAISAEAPSYKLGGDGSGGECDCIGLIIGAIRRSGGSWEGIHGSNYAARNEMAYLLPVTDADDLNVGEVVYKASMPGQTNYALPSRYAKDPDQRDYYHVGVVRSVSPLRIVHCTSPGGITTDTRLGKWTHRGWLSKISREEDAPMQTVIMATVVADSGSTVKMRATPSTDERRWWGVPVGTQVPVVTRQDGWGRIAYNGHSGWMMEKYLFFADDTATQQPAQDGDVWEAISDLRNRLANAETALENLGWSKADGGFG